MYSPPQSKSLTGFRPGFALRSMESVSGIWGQLIKEAIQLPPVAPGCQGTSLDMPGHKKARFPCGNRAFWTFLDVSGILNGRRDRDRTCDPQLVRLPLYQLSYPPAFNAARGLPAHTGKG